MGRALDNLKLDPKLSQQAEANRARQKHSNQWIKQREDTRDKLTAEDHRQRIKTGMLTARLQRAALGKVDMTTNQVQAAKVLLDKAIPTLQAVENTVLEVAANRSESDILNDLRELLKQHPDLIQQLLAEQAREQPGITAAPAQPITTSELQPDAAQQSASIPETELKQA